VDGPWRIKEFAARTGVAEPTLRAWERRYALVDPQRSDGGYRLYTPADEARVIAMRAHMARGVATAEAARLALAETPGTTLPGDPAALVEELLEAITAYDATRVDQLLEAALRRDRLSAITDVLLPALRAVGERWADGRLSVAHEHFASHLFERRLLGHTSGWDAGVGRLALLACPPGERHALGLLCFGLALAEHGWRVAFLGADMPVPDVAAAADRLDPDAVVLGATFAEHLADHAPQIRALAAAHRTLVGGAGANAEIARRAGAERLPEDPVVAARAL
jgi:DNA-binding transcriptional MerR regulator